jgi:hypothetical protein
MDSPTAPDPTNSILIFFLLAFGGRQSVFSPLPANLTQQLETKYSYDRGIRIIISSVLLPVGYILVGASIE